MQESGIARGAYHSFWPRLDALAQAEHFVETVDLADDDLPPALYLEKATNLDPDEFAARIKTWLDRVKALAERRPMIYTSVWYWDRYVVDGHGPPAWTGDYDLWVACYARAANPLSAGWMTWTYWQYTDLNSVEGIAGHVDLDRHAGRVAG